MCEVSESLNKTTSSTMMSTTVVDTTLAAIDRDEEDFPFWHVIFWVSPHFQAFVVSVSIIIFALPVSYVTGIFLQ